MEFIDLAQMAQKAQDLLGQFEKLSNNTRLFISEELWNLTHDIDLEAEILLERLAASQADDADAARSHSELNESREEMISYLREYELECLDYFESLSKTSDFKSKLKSANKKIESFKSNLNQLLKNIQPVEKPACGDIENHGQQLILGLKLKILVDQLQAELNASKAEIFLEKSVTYSNRARAKLPEPPNDEEAGSDGDQFERTETLPKSLGDLIVIERDSRSGFSITDLELELAAHLKYNSAANTIVNGVRFTFAEFNKCLNEMFARSDNVSNRLCTPNELTSGILFVFLTTQIEDSFAKSKSNHRNICIYNSELLKDYHAENLAAGVLSNLSLSNSFLEKINDNAFELDVLQKNLRQLRLNDNKIDSVGPKSFKKLVDLYELDLSSNRLRGVHVDLFESLANMKSLNLSKNEFETLNELQFNHLKRLFRLDLSGNKLNELSTCVFSGLCNLRQLDLSCNLLEHIKDYQFQAMVNLEVLNLSGNRLKSIDRFGFYGLFQLWELNMASNQIETIDENRFDYLFNLEKLDLSMNALKHLDVGAFKGLSNLKALHLWENQIERVSIKHFQHLNKLEQLYLNYNRIGQIEVQESPATDQLATRSKFLPNLKIFNLNNNRLDSLSESMLRHLRFAKEVTLNANQLVAIGPQTFESFVNLTSLSIASNKLARIRSGQFSELANLASLYLVNNQISLIEPNAFSGLVSLKKLNLNCNELAKIEPGQFDGLANLEELLLRNNRIEYIAERAFHGLSSLKKLSLSNNPFVIENRQLKIEDLLSSSKDVNQIQLEN